MNIDVVRNYQKAITYEENLFDIFLRYIRDHAVLLFAALTISYSAKGELRQLITPTVRQIQIRDYVCSAVNVRRDRSSHFTPHNGHKYFLDR